MTIFLMIAKEHLIAKLEEGRDNSISDDRTMWNKAATVSGSWFGLKLGRDTTVSTAKQKRLGKYIGKLDALTDCASDEETHNAIKALIEKYEVKAKASHPETFYDGNIGKAVVECHELLRKLKLALADINVKLLDIPYDNDPFNRFRYQVARYIFWRTINKPSIVAEDKKAAALASMRKCEFYLTPFKERPDYQTNCKRIVLENIEELFAKSKEICTKHGKNFGVEFSVAFFSTVKIGTKNLVPGEGELEDFLGVAVDEINGVIPISGIKKIREASISEHSLIDNDEGSTSEHSPIATSTM